VSAVKDSRGPVFAGIDIGGTSIKWMIVDEAGAILTQGNEPTDREAVAAQVGRIGVRLASDYPGLVGFGLICPGLVDEARGIVVYAANLELRGVHLARAVEEATPARQQILERAPRDHARDTRVDDRTVMAVRARPRAPL